MMKKTILVITLISFSIISYSQTHFGIKVGLNYVNNIPITDHADYEIDYNKYRLGYHFGVNCKIHFSDKFFISPELLYSNKGYKSKNINAILNLNYINFPVLFGYRPIEKLSVLLGPELGYLVSAKSKINSQTIDVGYIWDNNFDYGLSSGIQYDIFDRISIGLSYTHGFASVIKTSEMLEPNSQNSVVQIKKLQNRTFQFSVLYRIK